MNENVLWILIFSSRCEHLSVQLSQGGEHKQHNFHFPLKTSIFVRNYFDCVLFIDASLHLNFDLMLLLPEKLLEISGSSIFVFTQPRNLIKINAWESDGGRWKWKISNIYGKLRSEDFGKMKNLRRWRNIAPEMKYLLCSEMFQQIAEINWVKSLELIDSNLGWLPAVYHWK